MRVSGIWFCAMTNEAGGLARFPGEGEGLPERERLTGSKASSGPICPAGGSRIEIWPEGPKTRAGNMLQIEVDHAHAWAAQAKYDGLEPGGRVDAHEERICLLTASSGLPVSCQSGSDRQDG